MTETTDPIANVIDALDHKRAVEAQLAEARKEWVDAVVAARDEGITVSAIARATGVMAPNLFRLLADQKKSVR